MMEWVCLGAGVIVSVEVFLRLPVARSLNALKAAARKSVSTLSSSRISDHWKEVALQRYALQIFTGSVMSFLLLLLGFMPFGIVITASELVQIDALELALSMKGIAFSMVLGIVYVIIRKRIG